MKHLGDITKINGAEIEPVDVICGGSPCQDLSVAGKRAGLKHSNLGDEETTRSGLFMEQIRIVKEMRANDIANGRTDESVRCRYMVWENVPGAYSSGNPKGADFAAVLEEILKVKNPSAHVDIPSGGWEHSGIIIGEADGISVAWDTHDAQYWGVPQRRKRVCVVADFNGFTAGQILFAPEIRRETERTDADKAFGNFGRESRQEVRTVEQSLPRDSDKSRTARERIAGDIEDRIGESNESG